MNKKHAVVLLNVARAQLVASIANNKAWDVFVCNRMKSYMRGDDKNNCADDSFMKRGQKTFLELLQWIDNQLEDGTFYSWVHRFHNDKSVQEVNKLRLIWVDAMLLEINEGRFSLNNMTAINKIKKLITSKTRVYEKRMLKYALDNLTESKIYVCCRLTDFVEAKEDEALSAKVLQQYRRARGNMREWIHNQLEDVDTFDSFIRGKIPAMSRSTGDVFLRARRDWVQLMIAEIDAGRFNVNNMSPIEAIIEKLTKANKMAYYK